MAGAISWAPSLVMLVGATFGGYAGARMGRVLTSQVVRTATLLCTRSITILFFVRAYWPGLRDGLPKIHRWGYTARLSWP